MAAAFVPATHLHPLTPARPPLPCRQRRPAGSRRHGGWRAAAPRAVAPPPPRYHVAPLSAAAPAGAVHSIAAFRAGAFAPFPTASPDEARRAVAAILTRQLRAAVGDRAGGNGNGWAGGGGGGGQTRPMGW